MFIIESLENTEKQKYEKSPVILPHRDDHCELCGLGISKNVFIRVFLKFLLFIFIEFIEVT